jgi:8-oxo-dGTP diphosphatase
MKLATLCYLRQDGNTLMIHRTKKENDMHAGKWNGLGGKLEPGETPEECAIREIWEESGLRVKNLALRGVITFPGFSNEEDWYAFLFVADDFEGELIESPEGYLQWIPDEALLELNLWPGDRIFIPWLNQPGFFSGKFVYQDGELVEHGVNFYGAGKQ